MVEDTAPDAPCPMSLGDSVPAGKVAAPSASTARSAGSDWQAAAEARLAQWPAGPALAAVRARVAQRFAGAESGSVQSLAPEAALAVPPSHSSPAPASSPWRDLLGRLRAPGTVDVMGSASEAKLASAAQPAAAGPAQPVVGLKAVDLFRPDWTQLAVKKRLGQARRRVSKSAGPLNSHGLLARVLDAMGEASPAYMRRLLPYAEALVRLEDLLGTSGPEGRDVEAPPPARSGGRGARQAARGKPVSDRLID